MLLFLLPEPFHGMGLWRENIESQKPDNSPGLRPDVVKGEKVVKRTSGGKSP